MVETNIVHNYQRQGGRAIAEKWQENTQKFIKINFLYKLRLVEAFELQKTHSRKNIILTVKL